MEQIEQIFPKIEDDKFELISSMIAQGQPLREGIDMIVAAQNGALICVGDVESILMLGNGGFRIDAPFTPQKLFELSKMDGAIVLTDDLKQIVCANFHLNPDPTLVTFETGMRHRSAARSSSQTKSAIIAISKRRVQTTIYINGEGMTLDSDQMLLTKGNQGIVAIQNAKLALERATMRLSFMELDDIVTVADVTNLLSRFIYLITISEGTGRIIRHLGSNSGLLIDQLQENTTGVVQSFLYIIRDYASTDDEHKARRIAKTLLKLKRDEQTSENIMRLLGFVAPFAEEDHLKPRGFRVISRISMIDEEATARIIEEYGTLNAIVHDSKDGFDRLQNLELDNVRAIAKSFMQLRSTL